MPARILVLPIRCWSTRWVQMAAGVVALTVAARSGLWLFIVFAAVLLGWEVMSRRIVERRRLAVTEAIADISYPGPVTSSGYERSIIAVIAAATGTAGAGALDDAAELVSREHCTDRWAMELAHERLDNVGRVDGSPSPSRLVTASALAMMTLMAIGAWTSAEIWLAPTLAAAAVFGAALALRHDRCSRLPMELAHYATTPPWTSARLLPHTAKGEALHERAAEGPVDASAASTTEEPASAARLRMALHTATKSLPQDVRGPVAGVALSSCATIALSYLLI